MRSEGHTFDDHGTPQEGGFPAFGTTSWQEGAVVAEGLEVSGHDGEFSPAELSHAEQEAANVLAELSEEELLGAEATIGDAVAVQAFAEGGDRSAQISALGNAFLGADEAIHMPPPAETSASARLMRKGAAIMALVAGVAGFGMAEARSPGAERVLGRASASAPHSGGATEGWRDFERMRTELNKINADKEKLRREIDELKQKRDLLDARTDARHRVEGATLGSGAEASARSIEAQYLLAKEKIEASFLKIENPTPGQIARYEAELATLKAKYDMQVARAGGGQQILQEASGVGDARISSESEGIRAKIKEKEAKLREINIRRTELMLRLGTRIVR